MYDNMYGYGDMYGNGYARSPYGSYSEPQQRRQPPIDAVIRVNGLEGARMYNMPANSKVPLFNANEDVFYIKTTDGAGFPELKAYAFHEVPLDKVRTEYVTRDEFDQYKDIILELKELLENAKQPVREQSKREPIYAESGQSNVT